jgi:hypothetical protein
LSRALVTSSGEEAFGLAGEAGDEGDGGQVVAEPGAAPLGQRVEGVVDQVVGVAAAARPGMVMAVSRRCSAAGPGEPSGQG